MTFRPVGSSRPLRVVLAGVFALALATATGSALGPPRAPHFTFVFPNEAAGTSLDGRLLLLLSTDPSDEPRMQVGLSYKTQMVFGFDLDGFPSPSARTGIPGRRRRVRRLPPAIPA